MNPNEMDWDREVDIIIVGGGGAGMAAALSAAETDPDADILLIQKIDELGGSTTLSIGYFSAADTQPQADRGIDDSPDRHFYDIQKILDVYNRTDGKGPNYYFDYQGDIDEKDNQALRRLLVESAGETLDWLRELGCEYAGPYGEAPHSKPRCHQIKPDTEAYADVLGDAIEEQGIEVLYGTEARNLITVNERVRGVAVAEGGDTPTRTIGATRGVVLATGGYINDHEFREQYTTVTDAPPVNEYNTGDGHRMAQSVGADLLNMDMQWLRLAIGDPYYTFPEIASTVDDGAILVNSEGRRFTNEQNEYDQLFRETLHQPDQEIYLIFGERIAEKYTKWPHYLSIWGQDGKQWAYIEEYEGTDVLESGDSGAELAAATGFDSSAFEHTLETATDGVFDDVTGQYIDEFGREDGPEITESPYYALGPIQPFSLLTDGGVAIDTDTRALDRDGDPIPGLCVAGVTAGDIFLFGHGHHHAWIFTTGRLAGARVAARD